MAARDTPTAARTLTYLPAPIQAPADNTTNELPSFYLKLAVYTVAQGIFYAYAAKAFFVVSAGIYIYQIFRFTPMVHTANPSKYQEIRAWAIQAGLVMASVSIVFTFVYLSYFWSAFLILRSAKRIDCLRPLVQGILCYFLSNHFGVPYRTSQELANKRRWVIMEDYVQNYPDAVKQDVSLENWFFYFLVLAPSDREPRTFKIPSKIWHFICFHFKSDEMKFRNLHGYLNNQTQIPTEEIEFEKWALAIHQLQQLPIQNQLALGPHLYHIAAASSQEQRDQLPVEVKIVLMNERLKQIGASIPASDNPKRQDWDRLMVEFEALDRNQQAILGPELFGLVLDLPHLPLNAEIQISGNVTLAALKAFFLTIPKNSNPQHCLPWAHEEFKKLSPDLQTDFAAYVKPLKLPHAVFSPEMKALITS